MKTQPTHIVVDMEAPGTLVEEVEDWSSRQEQLPGMRTFAIIRTPFGDVETTPAVLDALLAVRARGRHHGFQLKGEELMDLGPVSGLWQGVYLVGDLAIGADGLTEVKLTPVEFMCAQDAYLETTA